MWSHCEAIPWAFCRSITLFYSFFNSHAQNPLIIRKDVYNTPRFIILTSEFGNKKIISPQFRCLLNWGIKKYFLPFSELRKKIIYPQSRRHRDTVLVSLKCTYRLKYTILCDWSVIKTYQFMWFILFSYQICSLYMNDYDQYR